MNHLTIFTIRSPYDSCDGLYSYGILTDTPLSQDMFSKLYSEWERMPVIENDGTDTYFLDDKQKRDFCTLCDCDSSFWKKFDRIFGKDSGNFFDGYNKEAGENWIATLYRFSLEAAAKRVLKEIPHEVIQADFIYDCHMINF
jgi:hypothetical protein